MKGEIWTTRVSIQPRAAIRLDFATNSSFCYLLTTARGWDVCVLSIMHYNILNGQLLYMSLAYDNTCVNCNKHWLEGGGDWLRDAAFWISSESGCTEFTACTDEVVVVVISGTVVLSFDTVGQEGGLYCFESCVFRVVWWRSLVVRTRRLWLLELLLMMPESLKSRSWRSVHHSLVVAVVLCCEGLCRVQNFSYSNIVSGIISEDLVCLRQKTVRESKLKTGRFRVPCLLDNPGN